MAIRRLKPIVDANGDPFYVVERDYIGAEHFNAQAEFTRNAHEALTRQHRADGVHDHLPIPRAVICGWGFSGGSGPNILHIDRRSTVMGMVQADGPNDPRPNAYTAGTLITGTCTFRGVYEFTFAIDLPSDDYGILNFSSGGEPRWRLLSGPYPPWVQAHTQIVLNAHNKSSLQIHRVIEPGGLDDGPFCFALVC